MKNLCLLSLIALLLAVGPVVLAQPPVTLPAGFKTATFQTNGKQLADPCGSLVVLKGVNKMSVFDNTDPVGAKYFREIVRTGANCVRIAWEMKSGTPATANPLTRLDALLTNAKLARLLPIVGLWDFTNTPDGGFSKLNQYVTYWTRPDVLALIRKHQTGLIINIGNEAATGDENNPADLAAYATAYKAAILKLRKAGIRVPLMIDGMDRGKSLHCFVVKGPEILKADPLRNVIFSFHPYWPKAETDALEGGQFIKNKFAEAAPVPIPIVLGELSKYGAFPGSAEVSPCSEKGLVDYQQFAQQAEAAGMGWLVWEWGPGNQFKLANDCPQMDMTTDGSFASLNNLPATAVNAWAKDIAITAPFSIKNTAQHTFFISSGLKACPNP
jgi:mannan endo-1,4-beta-mannosidase